MSNRMYRVVASSVIIAGCGSSDAQPRAPEGIPKGPVTNVASVNTGGRVSATITGGKTATAEMHDVSFCNSSVKAGNMSMEIFALAANDASWGFSIGNASGMPTVGEHVVDSTNYKGISASLVDKTTGKTSAEWQQYKAMSGSITVTRADSVRVVGSYHVRASPTSPSTSGAPVVSDGTFDAPIATSCARTKVMK